jgi:hypothetical protein
MRSCLRLTAPIVWAALCCALAPGAWAARVTLNDTGLTQCIDHHKQWSTNCAKSAQDAADGRDVHEPDPGDGVAGFSFRKVCRSGEMSGEGTCPADPALGLGRDDWGCVYDNVSRLMWEAKTNDGGIHDGERGWVNKGYRGHQDDAAWLVKTTNAEALCGLTHWRLPDALELHSLVDYGVGAGGGSHPAFADPVFFPHVARWYHWTSVSWRTYPEYAWPVDFFNGEVEVKKRNENAAVLLVQGKPGVPPSHPPAPAKERFIPSADGTEVTDTLTGLIWQRCAEGMTWNSAAQTCDGDELGFYWLEALDYAKAHRAGGWRLPNIKELRSLVDYETPAPAIDHVAFPNTHGYIGYYSSTTSDLIGLMVYTVWFGRGAAYQEALLDDDRAIRLVRRGRE